ncbi:hypothetical protein ABIA39_004662 [Nocardia sp. GAS34]
MFLGIPAIIFANEAKTKWEAGDAEGARSAADRAQGWALAATLGDIVGFVLAAIVQPPPMPATSNPASAGPPIADPFFTAAISAFARCRSSGSSSCGSAPRAAGVAKAVSVPLTYSTAMMATVDHLGRAGLATHRQAGSLPGNQIRETGVGDRHTFGPPRGARGKDQISQFVRMRIPGHTVLLRGRRQLVDEHQLGMRRQQALDPRTELRGRHDQGGARIIQHGTDSRVRVGRVHRHIGPAHPQHGNDCDDQPDRPRQRDNHQAVRADSARQPSREFVCGKG